MSNGANLCQSEADKQSKDTRVTTEELKPLNGRQRAFADYLLLHPGEQAEAYRRAGYTRGDAELGALDLLRRPQVGAYLQKERTKAARAAGFSKEEAVKFLVRVIDTPVAEVDENSDLCQEYQTTKDGVKCKMLCKLAALEKLAKLMGWNEPEKLDVGASDSLAELMRRVRGGGKLEE